MTEAPSFPVLLALLTDVFLHLPDPHTGENTRYSVCDAALGAFGVFFMQWPSFLTHQWDMQLGMVWTINGRVYEARGCATANQSFVDSGWRDTVLAWPGEQAKIAMTLGLHMGMYMYHCHILECEDMTMMRDYMIMDPDMSGM